MMILRMVPGMHETSRYSKHASTAQHRTVPHRRARHLTAPHGTAQRYVAELAVRCAAELS